MNPEHAHRCTRRWARALAACSFWLLAIIASPESWSQAGLLRARDLTPFGLLRLDMRPSSATEGLIGAWSFELQAAYQNTFIASENVERYLESRDAGRIELRPEDAQAILELPDDAYYLDVEVGVLDLIIQRRLTQQLSFFIEIPYLRYGEGQLDALIEDFHSAFGLGQMGRDLVARDRFQIVYRLGDARVQLLDRQIEGGFGDPVVGARYSPESAGRWNLVFEAAAKIAVDGQRFLLSTGKQDFGVQTAIQRRFGRHSIHGSLSAVYYSGGMESTADQVIPTLVLAYGVAATGRTSIVLQGYASSSAVRETDLAELKDNKYQISLGVQSRIKDWMWTLALTENIANFDNTPDIGVQLGLRYAYPF